MKLYKLTLFSGSSCFTNGAKYVWVRDNKYFNENGDELGDSIVFSCDNYLKTYACLYDAVEDFIINDEWLERK